MIAELPWTEIAAFAAALLVAGVVAGLLAGLFGIGGGAILVPVFDQTFALIGVDDSVRMHLAVGTSLAIIVPTSLRSFFAHRKKGAVDEALLKAFALPILASVVTASYVVAGISGDGLKAVFAVIALLIGLKLVFQKDTWVLAADLPGRIGTSIAGFLIGLLSALMGIGGGVLNNAFMTSFGRPIHQAVATSSGVGVLISVPGLLGFVWAGWGNPALPPLSVGYVNLLAVALIIPVTLLVAPYGVTLAHRFSKRKLSLGFGIFLLIVSARFAAGLI